MTKLTPIAAALMALSSLQVFADASVMGSINDNAGVLSGAKVSVVGTEVTAATNYQGKFELSHLPAGKNTLKVEYLGYQSKTFVIDVIDNQINKIGTLTLNVDDNTLEEVVSIGHMRRGAILATNMQKESNSIKNFLSSDGIGKLPDRNAAEAVQRIPGISIERDQGEGRFVAIRGLPSQWSSTSMNGDRLPTAEEETTSRAVAFDFFPTDIIELVEVSKAITPDMEGDAIGGNVNFITRRAPVEKTLSVNLAVGGAEKAEGGNQSFNLLYGDRSDDGKLGFLVNATAMERD